MAINKALRLFDGLEKGSIHSYDKLTWVFGTRFMTCGRVPKPFDSLITMSMKEGETVKAYLDRYWESYHEIRGVAASTFKVGVSIELNSGPHSPFDLSQICMS